MKEDIFFKNANFVCLQLKFSLFFRNENFKMQISIVSIFIQLCCLYIAYVPRYSHAVSPVCVSVQFADSQIYTGDKSSRQTDRQTGGL